MRLSAELENVDRQEDEWSPGVKRWEGNVAE